MLHRREGAGKILPDTHDEDPRSILRYPIVLALDLLPTKDVTFARIGART
jgi:hypothetical protein